MDQPPSYDQLEQPSGPSPAEKPSSAQDAAPTFHIRPMVKSDATGMHRIRQLLHKSLRSTLPVEPTLHETAAWIRVPTAANILQLVAVSAALTKTRGLSNLFARFSVESSTNVLAHAHLIPYQMFLVGEANSSCYDRTAGLNMQSLSEDELGSDMWRAVNVALVEEMCRRSKEEGYRFKTVIMTISYRDEVPSLVAYRNALVEAGFEQVGRLREVIDKGGILLDRVTLQKNL